MNYWLITYEVSRDHRMTWQKWNMATHMSPADWLNYFCRESINDRTGYTNVVLLSALEITPAEYKRLSEVLDQ